MRNAVIHCMKTGSSSAQMYLMYLLVFTWILGCLMAKPQSLGALYFLRQSVHVYNCKVFVHIRKGMASPNKLDC